MSKPDLGRRILSGELQARKMWGCLIQLILIASAASLLIVAIETIMPGSIESMFANFSVFLSILIPYCGLSVLIVLVIGTIGFLYVYNNEQIDELEKFIKKDVKSDE